MAAFHSSTFPYKMRIALLVTMVTLQLGDYVSTLRAIDRGAVEVGAAGMFASNPFALLAFKLCCIIWFAAILFRDKYPIGKRVRIGSLLCAFYAVVVASNFTV